MLNTTIHDVEDSRTIVLGLVDIDPDNVLLLGMCTRNLGAAFAPLFTVVSVNDRAIIMVAPGILPQTISSLLAAGWLGRQ